MKIVGVGIRIGVAFIMPIDPDCDHDPDSDADSEISGMPFYFRNSPPLGFGGQPSEW
jgi:hypothetical protein